jgi:nucleoside 2-deoxyribosyltransferase
MNITTSPPPEKMNVGDDSEHIIKASASIPVSDLESALIESFRALPTDRSRDEQYKLIHAKAFSGQKITSVFVVSPIGDPGTKTRVHADAVYNEIIMPACKKLGFDGKPDRSDLYRDSQRVTAEMTANLEAADMIIVVLFADEREERSKDNPNVYWEFGYRTALKKPVAILADENYTPPFDVTGIRNIPYNSNDFLIERAVTELAETMRVEFERFSDFDIGNSIPMDRVGIFIESTRE